MPSVDIDIRVDTNDSIQHFITKILRFEGNFRTLELFWYRAAVVLSTVPPNALAGTLCGLFDSCNRFVTSSTTPGGFKKTFLLNFSSLEQYFECPPQHPKHQKPGIASCRRRIGNLCAPALFDSNYLRIVGHEICAMARNAAVDVMSHAVLCGWL